MASRFSVKCLSLNFCLVFVHCPSVKFIFLSYNLQTSKSNNAMPSSHMIYMKLRKILMILRCRLSLTVCLKEKILPAKFWVCDKNLGYGEFRRVKGKRKFVPLGNSWFVTESGTWRQIDIMAHESIFYLESKIIAFKK